jgi:hypothetical protein
MTTRGKPKRESPQPPRRGSLSFLIRGFRSRSSRAHALRGGKLSVSGFPNAQFRVGGASPWWVLVQTNPIPRLPITDHAIASDARQSGLQIGDRGQPASVRSGPARAGCINKAKLGQAGVSGEQDGGTGAGQMRQTNPIPGRPTGPYHSTIPLFHHSSVPIRRRSCQTKPIHPAVPGSVVQTNPIWCAQPRGGVSL